MKKFADFANEPVGLEGTKIGIEAVLNREVTVTGFNIKMSKFHKNVSGKYLTLQFQIDGETRVTFTGSDVLINQLEKYGNEIPFLAVIRKINRYFTLT